jgi:hypothetical protein
MQQLKESSLGLPDFVTMTNYCEDKGYEIQLIRSRKGVTCNVYKENELLKSGAIIYDTCIEAQKEGYSKLYKALM